MSKNVLVKNVPPETVRLMSAAVEVRDSLRRLAAKIQSAKTPELKAAALEASLNVATVYGELLKAALTDAGARRHSLTAESRPPWETR